MSTGVRIAIIFVVAAIFVGILYFYPVNNAEGDLRAEAQEYCTLEDVASVEISQSEGLIKVTTSLLGGGSTYYDISGNELFTCPVVAPNELSEACVGVQDVSDWESVCATSHAETVTTRIDEGASVQGLKIVPTAVLEDSRCPTDVECVQAGTVRVEVQLSTDAMAEGEWETFEFALNEPEEVLGYSVVLLSVSPEPISTEEIDLSDYEFEWEIAKNSTSEDTNDLIDYLSNQMNEDYREEFGVMPIEGYEPDMYLALYEGLVPQDFDGVDALLGVYTVEDGDVVFTLDESEPVHSAARAISKEGMQTLLENVTERLDITVENKSDVDELLMRIRAAE